MDAILHTLSKSRLFAGLNGRALQEISLQVHERTFEPRQVVMLAYEPCAAVCLIARGGVRVRRLSLEGREYVLRMILRRAARFGRKLGFSGPFLADIAAVVIDTMGKHFGELLARRDFVLNTITEEEHRFLRTLDRGLERMNEIVEITRSAGRGSISGRDAFVLWTQDGFPYDLIRDIAEENGLTLRVYASEGAIKWVQENPNYLELYQYGKPRQVLTRGQGYLSEPAAAVTRIPTGHPEGYLEAFANIYLGVVEALRRYIDGSPMKTEEYNFPTVYDGLRGMRFIYAAVESAENNSTWMSI